MATFTYAPSTDGESADAVDINTGFQDLETIINGNIGTDNILDGSITEAKLSGAIPSSVQNWITSSGATYASNNADKEYGIYMTGDVTSAVGEGMRLEMTPTTSRGVESLDLEADSIQYAFDASPTGISFTNTFTAEAWIKVESYVTGSNMAIVSRYNGFQGWILQITGEGHVRGFTSGTGNEDIRSTRTVPVGEWTHIAMSMNVSSTSHAIYINGESVGLNQVTTTGTAITQGGNLAVGSADSTDYFDGMIKDVRVWDDIRTESEVLDNMNSELVGTEPGLVFYCKLEGDYTDETSNGNDLIGSGSPVFVTDSPFNAIEYAIVTEVEDYDAGNTRTPVTVNTGKSHNIPNDTFSLVRYSANYAPPGYPMDTNIVELQTTTEAEGVWQDWTPTYTNITVGNGSVSARYTRIGSTIHAEARVIAGTTTSFGNSLQISLPVDAAIDYALAEWHPIGDIVAIDQSAGVYFGLVMIEASTTVANIRWSQGGSAGSSTFPFTEVTTDAISLRFTYEAAS